MLNWLAQLLDTKRTRSAKHKTRGDALLDQGAWLDAAASYRQALQDDPGNAAASNNLALALAQAGQRQEARQAAQQASQLDPRSINSRYLLATLAFEDGELDQACVLAQQAVDIDPGFAAGWSFLGNGLREQGKAALSAAAYRTALALDPNDAVSHANLLMVLQAEGSLTQAELFAEHRRYAQQFEPAHMAARPAAPAPAPARLKIGYVSADFRRHAVAHFMIPVLEHHDRAAFEIHCYYNRDGGDELTQRFAELADHFVPIATMTDDELEARIRADGIDVLVDLSGHTAGNRLPVFARKPAPVQVTWLGYIDTTGLAAMDYRLSNADADPPGNDAFCSERLYRLPGLWWAFRPVPNLPEVIPLPAQANGHITFCSTNQVAKITPAMVTTWAAILHQVADARLAIMGIPGEETETHLAGQFAAHGIARERLQFHRFATLDAFRATLASADIALDTFPYNGGTTTCETLWLGLPCVTRKGRAFVSRMGHALLKEIGLMELVGDSMDEYVAIAVALAQDRPRLAQMRMAMRERLQASSLGDEAGFTRRLENAYRNMRASAPGGADA